jgi:hypothetical protein
MRLCAGSERSDLLMPDMNSLDFTVPTNSIRQTVEAVADDAVDALHARDDEGLDELIGHNICWLFSFMRLRAGSCRSLFWKRHGPFSYRTARR